MTLTGTNHGLSPLPNADEAQRLVHPCPFVIDREGNIMVDSDGNKICVVLSSCFNDATAPLIFYPNAFGHAGIDFAVGEGTRVHAMYGGRVTTATTGSGNKKGYGKYIEIKSCTNPDRQSGFVHRYAHLSEFAPLPRPNSSDIISPGNMVEKGQYIGLSGMTGSAFGAHLHVQLLPFNDSGCITAENYPGEPSKDGQYAGVATRIRGSMNFDCFIDPCGGLPTIIRYDRKLLSPRDAWAKIPVYTTTNTRCPLTQLGDSSRPTIVYGKHLGCYALLDTKTVDEVVWHQIRLWNYQTGWIRQRGDIVNPAIPTDIHRNVVWVHVQDMPVGLPTGLQASVNESTVTLRWEAPTEGASVTGYQIRRGGVDWYQSELVADTGSTDTHWTDTHVPPGRTTYAVAALSGKVQGPVSDIVSVNIGGQATATLDVQTVGQSVEARKGPYDASSTNGNRILADASFPLEGRLQKDWVLLGPQIPLPTGRNTQTTAPTGWVPRALMRVMGNLATVPAPPYLRLASWVTLGANVRSGPAKAYAPALLTLTDHGIWYEITGKNAPDPTWWRIRVDASTYGWIYADLVDTTGDLSDMPIQAADSLMPVEEGPSGEAATGTGSTSGSAAGDYRNLVTNPDGRWAVWKSGTTVTANFSSPRAPVQYYARQHPQLQFVLPVGFRPTRPVSHTVAGTRVNADRTPVANAQPAPFDLTVGTNGEMRYVDNAKVDDLGYVSYSVTHLTWQTDEALVAPSAPAEMLSDTGTYLNQQENWGSRWALERSRSGTRVTGSFGSTRSPVDYYANGTSRAAQLRLPADYRPTAHIRFQVTGAVRVNEDGSDSTDTRRVDFWLTVQPNGEMWYDTDASLETQGVGYLRYTVNVSWTTTPLVPTAPRELEAEEVAATTLELGWRAPAADGGAAIEGYRIQVWDVNDATWDNEEADTGEDDTHYDVADLDPYTTYTFRVAARNSAGWGAFGPALTVTTPRAAPGTPASLTAAATYDTVTLSWGSTSGTVTGYTLERKVGNGSWYTLVADTEETTRAWEDRTVAAATSYHYRVAAHNHNLIGSWSGTRSVTTAAAPTIPGLPTGLSVAPGVDSRLQLTWTAPTDLGGGVAGYQVERSPNATPRVWATVMADTGSTARTWEDSDVAPDTVYYYRVSAQNSAGVGMASAEAMGRSRPQLPLVAEAIYPLTAHAEPRTDAPVTATFAAYLPGRSYDLAARVPGAEGWWRVLLFEQSTQGPFWLPAAAGLAVGNPTALPQVPSMPQHLTAVPDGGAVNLTWRAPATGGTVTGYRLWRRTGTAAFAILGSDLDATVLTYIDTMAVADTDYEYRVQALSAESPGPWTDAISTAEPNAPTDLAATPTGDSQMTLTWTAPTMGSPVTGYRIERALDATPLAWGEVEADTGNTAVAWVDSGLAAATVYHYRVTARSTVGLGTVSTVVETQTRPQATLKTTATYPVQARAWPATEAPLTHTWDSHDAAAQLDVAGQVAGSNGWWRVLRFGESAGGPYWVPMAQVAVTGTTTDVPAAPGLPTALATTTTHDSVTLTWTAPTTGGPVTGYRIWRQTGMEAWAVLFDDLEATPESYTDFFLTPATTYRYRLQALSAAGAGTRTAAESATTDTVRAPDAPTALTAVPDDDSQMVLAWTAPIETGTYAISSYRIERAADANPLVWTDAVADTGSTDVTWSDSGLAADAVYHYRVRALSTAGEGDPSATAESRTRPQMALKATATYPLSAHAWPATAAPVTHTWDMHEAAVQLDIVGQVSGSGGWWRGLRFGRSAGGPYWVSAASVTVTGATTAVAAAPGLPTALAATATPDSVTLTWSAPATGGTVTGYRLWRQTGTGPMTVLGDDLAADTLTYTDPAVSAGTAYQYRLQALSAAGPGVPTVPVRVTPAAVAPLVRNYGRGSHTIDIPAGYQTLYIQLCGGAGGGGGAHVDDQYSGEHGGHGGCTFADFALGSGDVWTLVVGRGGAGGDTHDDDPEDGQHGRASVLRRNGSIVATGHYGRGGEAAVGWYQRASTGTTVGDSSQFPDTWPGDAPAPRGGARGPWFLERDGRPGDPGLARVLLV